MNDQQRIETAADNCEVLRARLARYEDSQGVPLSSGGGLALALMAALESVVHDERVPNEVSQEVAAVLIEAQCLNSSPVSAGEYGDAYQGAREDLAIWKRRALEAESKIREQDQIIDNLGNALNDENGPTFMGEPVIRAGGVDERAAFEAWYETTYGISLEPEFRANHFIGYVNDKANHRWTAWQARAALSAPSQGEQVREGSLSRESLTLAYRLITKELETLANGSAIDRFKSAQGEFRSAIAAAPSAGSQGGDV